MLSENCQLKQQCLVSIFEVIIECSGREKRSTESVHRCSFGTYNGIPEGITLFHTTCTQNMVQLTYLYHAEGTIPIHHP